jgi:mannose-6-phosphate isomerase-like protein (cupin superfamily)
MQESIDIRPWGRFEILSEGKNFKVKQITVSPQQRLSLQSHKNRTETWVVVEGKGKFQLNEFTTTISNGNIVVIQPGEKHRINNTSKTKDLVFIEVQYGKCNENDITRYEDDYGRKELTINILYINI